MSIKCLLKPFSYELPHITFPYDFRAGFLLIKFNEFIIIDILKGISIV